VNHKDQAAKPRDRTHDEVIAAFDRERDKAHELQRRHSEAVINSRRDNRPVDPGDHEPHR
jgi:hypothetical protein